MTLTARAPSGRIDQHCWSMWGAVAKLVNAADLANQTFVGSIPTGPFSTVSEAARQRQRTDNDNA
jgi:hypothetical protein